MLLSVVEGTENVLDILILLVLYNNIFPLDSRVKLQNKLTFYLWVEVFALNVSVLFYSSMSQIIFYAILSRASLNLDTVKKSEEKMLNL